MDLFVVPTISFRLLYGLLIMGRGWRRDLRYHQLGELGLVMQAIILAGGKGSRLRAEVPNLPKPMAPVAGRPFLEHQMGYWVAQGWIDSSCRSATRLKSLSTAWAPNSAMRKWSMPSKQDHLSIRAFHRPPCPNAPHPAQPPECALQERGGRPVVIDAGRPGWPRNLCRYAALPPDRKPFARGRVSSWR